MRRFGVDADRRLLRRAGRPARRAWPAYRRAGNSPLRRSSATGAVGRRRVRATRSANVRKPNSANSSASRCVIHAADAAGVPIGHDRHLRIEPHQLAREQRRSRGIRRASCPSRRAPRRRAPADCRACRMFRAAAGPSWGRCRRRPARCRPCRPPAPGSRRPGRARRPSPRAGRPHRTPGSCGCCRRRRDR